MIVYLLRHGIAADAAAGGDDAARRLTPRGRVRLELAARGMKSIRLECEALLTSPLPRAAETAAIVARVHGGMPAPRVLEALRPGVPAAEIVRALGPAVREKHVMLVGHEPGLSGVAALLLTGSTEGLALALKKGGLVALSLPGSAAPRPRGTPLDAHPAAAARARPLTSPHLPALPRRGRPDRDGPGPVRDLHACRHRLCFRTAPANVERRHPWATSCRSRKSAVRSRRTPPGQRTRRLSRVALTATTAQP